MTAQEIKDERKKYPKLNSLYEQCLEEIRTIRAGNPNFFNENWDNTDYLKENFSEFLTALPILCVFQNPTLSKKIEDSLFFKRLKKVAVNHGEFSKCIKKLKNKYPEIEEDDLLYSTAKYIYSKCKFETYLIISNRLNIKLNLTKEINNSFKRLRESPKNQIKTRNQIFNFQKGLNGKINHLKLGEIQKDKRNPLENFFNEHKNINKFITNLFHFSNVKVYQAFFGQAAKKHLLSEIGAPGYVKLHYKDFPFVALNHYNQNQLFLDLFELVTVVNKDENYCQNKDAYLKKQKEIISKNIKNNFYDTFESYKINMAKIFFNKTKKQQGKLKMPE